MVLGQYDLWDESTNTFTGTANSTHVIIDVASNLPANYTDIVTGQADAIEQWNQHGDDLIGSAFGFMDWMCLASIEKGLIETIVGIDYLNWTNLNAAQKLIALEFVPTKIIDKQGFTFFVTEAGSQAKAEEYLDDYIDNAMSARDLRYRSVIKYAYQQMGKGQGLQAEDDVLNNNLRYKFVVRGILTKAEDGVDGFEDWIQGLNGFASTGLLAKLNDLTWVLLDSNLANTTFCNNMVGISRSGLY